MYMLRRFRSPINKLARSAQPVILLAVRIIIGYALARAGWSKLTQIDYVSSMFAGLGIPLPQVSAVLVGLVELGGGLLLVAGLATRMAAAALSIVLVVALFAAHSAEATLIATKPDQFIAAPPVPYLMATLLLFAFGAGRISLDGASGDGS